MAVTANDPTGDYIQIDAVDQAAFPDGLCHGSIRWKRLYASPESGPLNFIDEDGNTIALVGCQRVLEAWNASRG